MLERVRAVWRQLDPWRKRWGDIEDARSFASLGIKLVLLVIFFVYSGVTVSLLIGVLLGIIEVWWPLIAAVPLLGLGLISWVMTLRTYRSQPLVEAPDSPKDESLRHTGHIDLPTEAVIASPNPEPDIEDAGGMLVPENLPSIQIIDGFSSEDSLSAIMQSIGQVRRHKDFTVEAAIYVDAPIRVREVFLAIDRDDLDDEVNLAPTKFEASQVSRNLIQPFMFAVPMRLWGSFSFALIMVTDRGEFRSTTWTHGMPKASGEQAAGDEGEPSEQ